MSSVGRLGWSAPALADEVRPRLAAGRRIGTGAACPPSQSQTQTGETSTAEVSTRKARWALRLCGPSWTAGQVKGGGGARATAGGQTWGSENEGDELIRETAKTAMYRSVSCSVHASGELSCLCACEAGKGPEELTFPPPLASLPSPLSRPAVRAQPTQTHLFGRDYYLLASFRW